MEPIIKVENVNFYYNYGKATEFQALKNINMEIYPGEFVGVFGQSGCGKSTLLYMLAGVEKPQLGKVIVQNKNLVDLLKEDLAFYRQMGLGIIFQNFNLIPSLTAMENAILPLSFIGISRARGEKRVLEIFQRLGITELINRYPHEISGGQQQRVGIARALVNDPPIILADEPIGNLDSTNAKIALNLLKEINLQEGKTIIMVTHQAWTLKDNVERIFYMKDGEIIRIEKETPKVTEVVKKIGSSYYYKKLFTGLPRANVYAQILSSLILRGYSRPEIKRLEELIYKRLRREIDKKLFKELLDKPFQEGGVGLWRQKAERVANYVESVTKKRKELKKIYKELEKNPEDPLFEEVAKLQNWLFEDYKMRLSSLQKSRLREAISGRIKNIILPEHLIKIFDLPIEEGGVGLKIGTALKMGEKLEILLGRKEVSLERM